MDAIAIYYNNIIICWSSIIICAGIIVGFLISNSFYSARNKYGFGAWVYLPLAIGSSVFLSRIIHWYCHMEQYSDFKTAITRYDTGDYCMIGVLIGTWIIALLMQLTKLVPDRYNLLDAFAPGIAFTMGIIRLSDIYNTSCRGKILVNNPKYQHLPIASATIDAAGNIQYRFATFFVSFILFMIATLIIVVFSICTHHTKYKTPAKSKGHTYRLFLLLFAVSEIIMDSTRYDASHLYFSGEKLAFLNKGASFMGLSQFLGALLCIYLFTYYMTISIKANGKDKKHIILLLTYLVGFTIAGVSEYLVQRYSSMYLVYYGSQSFGVILVMLSVLLAYKTCILLPKDK